jgi:hypothetical protein
MTSALDIPPIHAWVCPSPGGLVAVAPPALHGSLPIALLGQDVAMAMEPQMVRVSDQVNRQLWLVCWSDPFIVRRVP